MITLFDYQKMAFDLIVNAFRSSAAVLAVMATGLGKTIVAAFWAKEELRKKRKGLFLCHDNGILEQAMKEFKKVLGDKVRFASFFGPDKDFDADKADMVFASFQTYVNWKNAFFENEFDFIIVDESHHGQAPTFKEVICYFKPKKLLGITATPDRMDLKDIREIFGEEVVNFTLEEAIAKGWLTQVEYHILNDSLSHWKLRKIMKDVFEGGERVSVKQINETVFIKKRDDEIAKTIQNYAGSSKKAIIFCEKIEHAENFQQYLPSALTYHSKVAGGAKENRRRLDAFREGSLQFILAVDKANEGLDVPDAELVVFLRCTDSKTIFYQQLGRGLRKVFGKEKVIVLDFVANCERLIFLKEMAQRTKEFAGNHFMLSKELLRVSGSAFDFIFSDDQVDIVNLIKRINEPFYETWQEASEAAIKLGVKNPADHSKYYKFDPKLPSNPNHFYDNFPGWTEFLGRSKYLTWQEASAEAVALGIKFYSDYLKNYKSNPKLPSSPDRLYKDFPGWTVFLGRSKKEFYPTWQEAKEAVNRLNIQKKGEYKKRYIEDLRLPSNPDSFYSDFPGYLVFFTKKGGLYLTWQEAGIAASNLGIISSSNYRDMHELDPKLPANPYASLKDFPGWHKFLGRTKKTFHSKWQEASAVAIGVGISCSREYKLRHKEDPKLPSNPDLFYSDFPGWKKFLGKEE